MVAVRTLVKACGGVVFVIVVVLGLVEFVSAKGPVSATISGPGIERPMELVDGADVSGLTKLMEQTGLWYGTGDLPRPIVEPKGELRPGYTLNWINAGPPEKSVEERTIRQMIYLHAEDGPVIHTPPQEALDGWGPGVIGWFAAPEGLRDTLEELGVPVSMEGGGGGVAAHAWRYLAWAALVIVVGMVGALALRRIGVAGKLAT